MKCFNIATLLFAATALSACAGSSSRVIELQDDRACGPLYVTAGQELLISLDANPSTGYSWLLTHQPEFLTTLERDVLVRPETADGMVGVSGKSVWRYQVNGKGSGNLQYEYQRPWQAEFFPTQSFNCQIISH